MKILFAGLLFPTVLERLKQRLPGHEILSCQPDEIETKLAGVSALITIGSEINDRLMGLGQFGFIQQFGVGLEKIDIASATRNGVWVSRAPSTETGNAQSVAEHTLMLMLMLAKHYPQSLKAFQEQKVGTPKGEALYEKRVAIIGLGGIGRTLAPMLKAIGMTVTGVHEYPERGKPDGVDTMYGIPQLRDAVQDADFVVLSLNYTASRHHMISSNEIAAMKKGAYLINIARGGLLDESALEDALKSGQLAGAGLDVFWEEPADPAHPLFKQNVIATPHTGGVTDITFRKTTELVADNMKRFTEGMQPLYTVNNPSTVRKVS